MEIAESIKFSGMTIPELEKQLRQPDALIKEQARRIKELEKEIEELKELLVEKAESKSTRRVGFWRSLRGSNRAVA